MSSLLEPLPEASFQRRKAAASCRTPKLAGANVRGVGPGLYRLRKNPWDPHPEEPQATKDLRSSLKLQLRGFFSVD